MLTTLRLEGDSATITIIPIAGSVGLMTRVSNGFGWIAVRVTAEELSKIADTALAMREQE